MSELDQLVAKYHTGEMRDTPLMVSKNFSIKEPRTVMMVSTGV
jgi:hypothetical protein